MEHLVQALGCLQQELLGVLTQYQEELDLNFLHQVKWLQTWQHSTKELLNFLRLHQ